MSEINKGDVVQLNSGGPDMTVQSLDDYSIDKDIKDGVLCAWFVENQLHTGVFDQAALRKIV